LQHKAFSTGARMPVVRLTARLTRIPCPLAVASVALQRRARAGRRGRHRGAGAEIRVSRAAPALAGLARPRACGDGYRRLRVRLRVREGVS